MISFFQCAVQCQVLLVPLKSVNPGDIVHIMARLSRQKSDDFIVNQAAAFAASSNMTGKYASAGGIPPIAEWQRS